VTFDARVRESPVTKPESASARSADELRRIMDRIAALWLDGVTLTDIAAAMDVKRGVVAGLVSRARIRGDDVRFLQRPRPPRQTRQRRLEADRARYRRQHPSAARRAPLDKAPVVEAAPLRPASAPSGAVTFAELCVGQCKFVVNDAERSSGFLFCAQPVEKLGANYCPEHAAKVRSGAATGGKFVLKAISNRLG
jgi:hypothetical protein